MDLYVMHGSGPCRSVDLVASALGIEGEINYIHLDLFKGDHLKPDYVKLNPQQIIPTLVDDGFTLWESRTICRYLVNKYGGSNNSLYPKDPKTRALVDQRLDFDLGTLQTKFAAYFYPPFYGLKTDEGSLQRLQDALGLLNTFLEGQKYVAGNCLTIADLCLVTTTCNIEVSGSSLEEYPSIIRWLELLKKTAPNYQKANEEPLALFKAFAERRKNFL